MSIVRVEIPNSSQMPMFYNTETKEYDYSVKSAIIATVDTLIYSEASLKIGTPEVAGFPGENNSIGQFQFARKLGRVFAPTVDLKYDRNYERVIDSILTGVRPVFYLPDTEETIQKLISTFGPEILKGFRVGIANKYSHELKEVHKVPNYNEFCPPNSISDLIGADARRLLSEHEGGLQSYLSYRQLELDLIKQGVSELKLSRLTKDDILEMLKNKDKKEKLDKQKVTPKSTRSSKVK